MNKTDKDKSRVLSLLKDKRDNLSQMLEVTKNTPLSATQDSVFEYADMINKRQPFVDTVERIQSELSSIVEENGINLNDDLSMEAKSIIDLTNKIIEDILELDESNSLLVSGMMDDLRKDIKGVNDNKSVNSYYQYGADLREGMLFDKKK